VVAGHGIYAFSMPAGKASSRAFPWGARIIISHNDSPPAPCLLHVHHLLETIQLLQVPCNVARKLPRPSRLCSTGGGLQACTSCCLSGIFCSVVQHDYLGALC
jgi:hypothetical protein